jgi:hypothetical protein
MKRRLPFLITLALLLVVGITTGCALRREAASQTLLCAIQDQDTPAALAALKAGADPNIHEHFQDTPRSFRENIKQLWDNLWGRKKSITEERKAALLLYFFTYPKEDAALVRALLEAGADPDATEGSDNSPLVHAATREQLTTLRLLVQYHANPNLRDREGRTPLDWQRMLQRNDGPIEAILRNAGAKTSQELAPGLPPRP